MLSTKDAGNDQNDWFFFAYFFVRKGRLFLSGLSRKEGKMYDIVESGKRIAGLRKNAGYTQEQFGENVGLSYRSIADIERGYRGTSIDALVDISNLLNVSLDYLVLGVERHGEKGDKHVLEVVRGLSEEKKLFAAKILRGILNSLDE